MNHLGIVLRDDWPHGLADLYARRGQLGYFDETTVSGLPAVYAAERDERASVGSCVLSVGVSDTSVMWVQFVAVDNTAVPSACKATASAAAAAISTARA